MSRTPAQDVDAIDRHNQYLMKIKRWVARDVEREEGERQRIQDLLVEVMALLYKRTPAVDPAVRRDFKTTKPARKAG